jgi:hypothetical protein
VTEFGGGGKLNTPWEVYGESLGDIYYNMYATPLISPYLLLYVVLLSVK